MSGGGPKENNITKRTRSLRKYVCAQPEEATDEEEEEIVEEEEEEELECDDQEVDPNTMQPATLTTQQTVPDTATAAASANPAAASIIPATLATQTVPETEAASATASPTLTTQTMPETKPDAATAPINPALATTLASQTMPETKAAAETANPLASQTVPETKAATATDPTAPPGVIAFMHPKSSTNTEVTSMVCDLRFAEFMSRLRSSHSDACLGETGFELYDVNYLLRQWKEWGETEWSTQAAKDSDISGAAPANTASQGAPTWTGWDKFKTDKHVPPRTPAPSQHVPGRDASGKSSPTNSGSASSQQGKANSKTKLEQNTCMVGTVDDDNVTADCDGEEKHGSAFKASVMCAHVRACLKAPSI